MTRENDITEGPDPATTFAQAAALAEHLRLIGVEWLPAADPQSVRTLAEQFRRPGRDDPPAETTSATPTDASDNERVAAGRSGAGQPDSAGPPIDQRPQTATSDRAAASATTRHTPSDSFSLLADSADPASSYPGAALSVEDRSIKLAQYAERVASCTRCEILSKCRTKTVFGEGRVNPRVVFFGEGPGRDEDLSGRPFVGKAGQLLTKMIQACKFQREDVYIMNTVKCRPPNNRNPESTEVENCREYFEAQLNILRPEYIVCLGLVSAQALLRTKLSVGRMRGKFHQYFDSKVLVTYHPSYLLRTPAAKKAAWEDLQIMLRDAGLM